MPDEKQTEDDPKQSTDKGLEIPVPTEGDFFGALDRRSLRNPSQESVEHPATTSDLAVL